MELKELIENYGIAKAELDVIKKDTDKMNKQIKDILLAEGMTEEESDNYYVKLQPRKSESLDEDAVIEILKTNKIRGIVKTKEYVDEDALENAIYHGKLDKQILQEINKCKIVKESTALLIKEK